MEPTAPSVPVALRLTAGMRLAFVGQGTFFEACALPDGVVGGWQTSFVEFRKDGDAARLLQRLRALDPDVIVVFRPEVVPDGLFGELRATVVGWLTEPLPRAIGPGGGVRHEDLERRLWELGQIDAANVDRVVAFDPHIVGSAEGVLSVWRSLPLPVSDRFFLGPGEIRRRARPQALFVGRSTPHRERLLSPSKHNHEVLHLAFGVDAAMLQAQMREHDVAINLHNEAYASFENRVCLHLAAGHIVLSEPLSPLHGLEPGIDFVEIATPGQLEEALVALKLAPAVWHRVRMRGRRKAEGYRASRVYPRLVADLLADVAAFGSARGGSLTPAG